MISFFSKLGRYTRTTLCVGAITLLLVGETAAQTQSEATKKLFDAVYQGNLAQVQISIAGGGDINAVNAWGITPVDLAVDKGHFEIAHFLLQVRELQSQKTKSPPIPAPANVTSLGAPAKEPSSIPSPAPTPTAAPVAEVYAPPADSGPWSATVVTSEPPPPVIAAGPSPFDQEASTDAALPIIGTVRGPVPTGAATSTRVQVAVEETFQEAVKQPQPPIAPTPPPIAQKVEIKPELVKATAEIKLVPEKVIPDTQEKEVGIWNNIRSLLNLEDTEKTETTPPSEPAPKPLPVVKAAEEAPSPPMPPMTPKRKLTPVMEVRKSASLALPTAPVSPPNVKGPPPPIDVKVLPESVTPAPMSNLPEDDLETPQVVPVRPQAPPVQPKAPPVQSKASPIQPEPPAKTALRNEDQPEQLSPNTSLAKVTRIDKPESPTPKSVAQGPSGQQAVQVGSTTPPGKTRIQEGFFSKVMSIFSSDDETKKADKETTVANKPPTQASGDWSVKNIQQAQVMPRKPTKKVVRELPDRRLQGVILSIGKTTALGKVPPPQAPAPWYYRTCINKKLGSTVFCIEPLDWPGDIRPYFLTDSILYEGTQSIVRYDEGAATYYHTLFPSESYSSIVDFFSRRYGPPTQRLKRSIAPLAEPRRINPTVIWQSIAPVTNLLTTLEIRMFDDNRGGFPDTRRGAIYLYHEWSQSVFPQLSSVELMLLRSEAKQR